jgi:hypothetical protein
MCWNLRNSDYCILNKKYSQEDYQKEIKKIYPKTYQEWQRKRSEFLEIIKNQAAHKYARIEKSNNCTGDQIGNCQNVQDSYYAFESVNCSYCYDISEMRECYDTYEPWKGELQYECHAMNQGYNVKGCSICYENRDLSYCEFCYNSKDLFGCISLRHKKYCILNKQYTEEDYKKLLPQIIEHLKKTGEWGEFFPMAISPFAYNETVAQEYYPLTKEQILAKGLKWKEEEEIKIEPNMPVCLICGKNFRIIPQEIKFYNKMGLPQPEKCYKCRYQERLKLRDPRGLWLRKCFQCGQEIKSIYASYRPERVYCEECYQKAIY